MGPLGPSMGPPAPYMGPPRPLAASVKHHHHHDLAARGDVKPHNFLHSAHEHEGAVGRSSAGSTSVTQNFLNVGVPVSGTDQTQMEATPPSLDPIKRLAAMVDRQSGIGHTFDIGSSL